MKIVGLEDILKVVTDVQVAQLIRDIRDGKKEVTDEIAALIASKVTFTGFEQDGDEPKSVFDIIKEIVEESAGTCVAKVGDNEYETLVAAPDGYEWNTDNVLVKIVETPEENVEA